MFAALKQHSKMPSQLRLLEGLRALEALQDARVALAPVFEMEVLMSEGRHFRRGAVQSDATDGEATAQLFAGGSVPIRTQVRTDQ